MTGWLDLPWLDLPASVRVDILGVLAYRKPAIRIPVGANTVAIQVATVIAEVGWSAGRDDEYMVAAPTVELAVHILDVDRSTLPHTLELGMLLGYPECCAGAAAAAGEDNIDNYAKRLGGDCERDGTLDLDPRGYVAGLALVPYVACSPRCPQALNHAQAARRHVMGTIRKPEIGEPWRTWWRALDTLRQGRRSLHRIGVRADNDPLTDGPSILRS